MSWYHRRPDLLSHEYAVLKNSFPQFELFQSGKAILCNGWLETNSQTRYEIIVEFPEDYPYTAPKVYSDDLIEGYVPHTFSDGRLCLYYPNEPWLSGYHRFVAFESSIVDVIGWTAKWLAAYEIWRETSNWPGPSA